jgi:hypothetical protein
LFSPEFDGTVSVCFFFSAANFLQIPGYCLPGSNASLLDKPFKLFDFFAVDTADPPALRARTPVRIERCDAFSGTLDLLCEVQGTQGGVRRAIIMDGVAGRSFELALKLALQVLSGLCHF